MPFFEINRFWFITRKVRIIDKLLYRHFQNLIEKKQYFEKVLLEVYR